MVFPPQGSSDSSSLICLSLCSTHPRACSYFRNWERSNPNDKSKLWQGDEKIMHGINFQNVWWLNICWEIP